MPNAAAEIWSQLGLGTLTGASATPAAIDPAKLKWGALAEGTKIGEVKPLFPRIDKARTMAEISGTAEVNSSVSKVEPATISDSVGVSSAMSAQQEHSGRHATEADAVFGAPQISDTRPKPPRPRDHDPSTVQGGEKSNLSIWRADFFARYCKWLKMSRLDAKIFEPFFSWRGSVSLESLRLAADIERHAVMVRGQGVEQALNHTLMEFVEPSDREAVARPSRRRAAV